MGGPTAYDEVVAYEYLFSHPRATRDSMAHETVLSGRTPHEALVERFGFVAPDGLEAVRRWLDGNVRGLELTIWGSREWPERLMSSRRPTPILYHLGDAGLLASRNVAVIGSRRATKKGRLRAARIARELTRAGVSVTTGLAEGIDTAATEAALRCGGHPIAVIGTPIDSYYPKGNWHLQQNVADLGLVVSQVPLYRYSREHFEARKSHFPERNELMSALADATVIVEAADRSGTLIQARFCLDQGRPLFIMRSAAENLSVSWPADFLGKDGVHILDSTEELLSVVYGHPRPSAQPVP